MTYHFACAAFISPKALSRDFALVAKWGKKSGASLIRNFEERGKCIAV
jgi:hypothetical protein